MAVSQEGEESMMMDTGTRGQRGHELAREMTTEERAEELPCVVRHPDAGGQCERLASVKAYGLCFCEVHGAEVKIGAHEEVLQDAADFVERLANPYAPPLNGEVEHILRSAVRDLMGRQPRNEPHNEEETEALLRAYPVISERVDQEIYTFDYQSTHGCPTPEEDYHDARGLLHRMMREAYEAGFTWMVEMLEYEREHVSAQLAFAMEDYNRRVGPPQV